MKKIIPLLFIFVISGCSLIHIKDPVKTSLYVIKSEWLAVREYVIRENIAGNISNEELADFKKKDDKFKQVYDLAVTLYLAGVEKEKVDTSINDLKTMLLEVRKKYYKGE